MKATATWYGVDNTREGRAVTLVSVFASVFQDAECTRHRIIHPPLRRRAVLCTHVLVLDLSRYCRPGVDITTDAIPANRCRHIPNGFKRLTLASL